MITQKNIQAEKQNANTQKWSAYIFGAVNRQDFLERAFEWVSKGNIDDYISRHRKDANVKELKIYFNSVIDWTSSVFIDVESEMRGLERGRMYEEYHKNAYDPKKVSKEVHKLYVDSYVKNRKGVFEYILGGSTDTKLLNVRVFDEATKKAVYATQTKSVKAGGKSNCSHCAIEHDANKEKFEIEEMEVDHITPWHEGGKTIDKNCQLLCKECNRRKSGK